MTINYTIIDDVTSANTLFTNTSHGVTNSYDFTASLYATNYTNKNAYGTDITNFNVSANVSDFDVSVNVTDFDVSAYVTSIIGPKRGGLSSVVALTFVYTAIFFTGIIGNVFTCIVIARNTHMHTATNLYLFSLAISDVLMLVIGLPPELYSIWEAYPWIFGEFLCIFKTYISEMTSYASVLTITAFTIERYVAICHPIKAQLLSRPSRALKIILLVWMLSLIAALPFPVYTKPLPYLNIPNTTTPINDTIVCNIRPEMMKSMFTMFQVSFFLFFVTPMTLITVLYVLIGRTLGNTGFTSHTNNNRSSSSQARRAIVKMLVAVVIAFFVCWAPFHAQRLMTSWIPHDGWTTELAQIQGYLFYVSGVLYYISSTVNPILYNVMSRKYRTAFTRTLCRCCFSTDQLYELDGRSMYLSGTNVTLVTSTKRLSRDASSAISLHSNGYTSYTKYGSNIALSGRASVVCELNRSELCRSSSSRVLPVTSSKRNGSMYKRRSPDCGFLVQNALLTTPTRYRPVDDKPLDTQLILHSYSHSSNLDSPSPRRKRRIKGTYL